jgi:hypothetical protein
LGDRVRAEYGFLWESVKFLDRLNFVSPYGRLIYKLDDHRDLQLRYASGVPHQREATAAGTESLRQQVSSLGLFPRMAVHEGRPTVQRTEHVEIAYREERGKSLLEIAVYQDRLNDTALSASIPAGIYEGEVLPDLFANQATLNAGRFRTAGYRVSYARKLRDHLQAAVGFGATGVLTAETQELQTTELDELRQSLKMNPAQLVMASVSADLPRSGTQFVTTYQWSSRSAVLAPDMYNDFAARSDPGLNLIIRQPLPFSGGLPGKLEATAYLNNLLKAGYIPIQSLDGQRMYLLQAIRSYRGALSFVF